MCVLALVLGVLAADAACRGRCSFGAMDLSQSSESSDESTSVDSSPVFVVSPPASIVQDPLSNPPFAINLTEQTMDITEGLADATNDAQRTTSSGVLPVEDSGAAADHADAVGRGDQESWPPGSRRNGSSAEPLRYGQERPGPSHGRGGRKRNSGHRTREKFGCGLRRALGKYLCETTIDSLVSNGGASGSAAQSTLELLESWAGLPGSEQVWFVPGVFGVVARWGDWGRDAAGDAASVCVWLASDGRSRCTCVGSNVHLDNHMYERETACQHAGTLDAAVEELSTALNAPASLVKRQLGQNGGQEEAAGDTVYDAGKGATFHVLGGLYVAVCPTPFGPLPVPVYLTAARSSCALCPGARTRVCSHLAVAKQSGAPYGAHRASAQSAVRSLEVSAVSRLPIPLHDCVAAVRKDAAVTAMVISGGVLRLGPPRHCEYCTSRGKSHKLKGSVEKKGVIVSSGGFASLIVVVSKCSSCKQWVSKDGRDDHVVLLTTTTAATVSWARSICHEASDGTALTTSTTRWLRRVTHKTVAGVIPQGCPTRSGRTLRNIALTAMKLMVDDLPPSLFSCAHCMDADGRYKCVSGDSIWVGFGSGADHVRFEHVTEAVAENRRAVRAAYLVRGETVRRVLRDVMKPRKEVKLMAKSTRAAELAVGLLLPDALPANRLMEATAGEKAVSALLGSIFDMDAAAAKLLAALKGALKTYKTRNRAEAERRSAAADHLSAYIDSKKASIESSSTGTGDQTPTAGGAAAPLSGMGPAPSPRTEPGRENSPSTRASAPTAPAQCRSPGMETGVLSLAGPKRSSFLAHVTSPTPASAEHRRDGRQGASVTAPTTAPGQRRRPDCGRKPFRAGKGDVDADSPFLLPAVGRLAKDGRRELLSLLAAITLDSVVLPFRPSHAAVLRTLADCLTGNDAGATVGSVLAMSTSTTPIDHIGAMRPVVELLRDLRFLQLGLRSSASLFPAMPGLGDSLAQCFTETARAIDLFVLEWRGGSDSGSYQRRWEGAGQSQQQLREQFVAAYPKAASGHRATGVCAPTLPQCRPEPFLLEEVLSTGMCSKNYAKAHKFSPGVMTFCCGCKHPLILAFSVLDRKEAPQVLMNMLLTRFARLPRFLVYDFACGAFRVALGKIGWLLMDCTILSDRFHIFNHLCSDAFDPRSYAKMDGVDSGAPEQRNAPIRRLQTTLQGMGVIPYTNLLAFQTGVLNHEARVKWRLGVDRLPDDVDIAGMYFETFPCQCCDAINNGDREQDGDASMMSDGSSSSGVTRDGADSSDDSSMSSALRAGETLGPADSRSQTSEDCESALSEGMRAPSGLDMESSSSATGGVESDDDFPDD